MGQGSSFQPKVVSSSPPRYTYFYLYDFFHNKVLEVQSRFIKKVKEYPIPNSELINVKITYHSGKEELYHYIRHIGTYES